MTALELRIHDSEKNRAKVGSTFSDALALFQTVGETMGYSGIWTFVPYQRRNTRSQCRFKLTHFDKTELRIRLKPAGNDSCWEFRVIPPSTESIFVLGRDLSLWNGWNGHGIPDAVQANKAGEDFETPSSPAKTNGATKSTRKPKAKAKAEPPTPEKADAIAMKIDDRIATNRTETNPTVHNVQIDQMVDLLGVLKDAKDKAEAHQKLNHQLATAQGYVDKLAEDLLKAEDLVAELEKKIEADLEGKAAIQSLVALSDITSGFKTVS